MTHRTLFLCLCGAALAAALAAVIAWRGCESSRPAQPPDPLDAELNALTVDFARRLEQDVRPIEDPRERARAEKQWNAERRKAVRGLYERHGRTPPAWAAVREGEDD